MLFSQELVLISIEYTEDKLGNQIPKEIRSEVYCNVKSVTRAEFYNASTNGMKPSLTFVVHLFEYNDEELVEYEGKKFRVIRTYMNNVDTIELVCERVLADEN